MPGLKQCHLISGVVWRREGVPLCSVSATASVLEAQPAAPTLEDVYLYG